MKLRLRTTICLLICAMLLFGSFVVQAEEEQVKISDKEYLVSLMDANSMFISNDKPISSKVGSKMFLTYTVEEVTKNTVDQNGVIATSDNTLSYPYSQDGQIEYTNNDSFLFDEGYTYVFRFERTETGFTYNCAKMKDDETKNIYFTSTQSGNLSDGNYQYYGVWVDGGAGAGVTALLNHVRCYDEKGNDLGIHFNKATGTIQNEANKLLDVHHTVNANYGFKIEQMGKLAISSKYPTKSNVIYMEYEVSDVTQDDTIQQGVIFTRAPENMYPHSGGDGILLFNALEKDDTNKPLLRNGAKYFICFEKTEEGCNAIIQCTLKGETETFSFPYKSGTYSKDFPYVALWFGDSSKDAFTATFKNFKCYDAEGNSLGVQLRDESIPISFRGELEDYSKSKATYYCEANNEFIVLKDDKKVSKQIGSEIEEGSYKIMNSDELYLTFKAGKETYHYSTLTITDEEGNKYKRLKESKVTFVTGEEKITLTAEASNGYRVEQPDAPTKEGNTFKGWYLGDETAFNFDTVVTESLTLYAMWQDGDGNEYLAVDQLGGSQIDMYMIYTIAASAVILAISITGCIMVVKRRKNNVGE